MRDVALDILVSRLRWPVPRTRWETARSLARLIRAENADAVNSLTDWIRQRRLESEVVLGLGVIDAFDLGHFFDYRSLYESIAFPSLLSDWLLRRNFPDAEGLETFRLGYAPDVRVQLSSEASSWFERYRRAAVPPSFSITLQKLEEMSGAPLMKRWEHEWRWLQMQHHKADGDPPRLINGSDRNAAGQYDSGQRELYVSAFLRCLHWAVRAREIPREWLEMHALIGMTLNRGLADIAPYPRPRWDRGVAHSPAELEAMAREIWSEANTELRGAKQVIALNTARCSELSFVEFSFNVVAIPRNLDAGESQPAQLMPLEPLNSPGALGGVVGQDGLRTAFRIDRPVALTQQILIDGFARAHVDLAENIAVLSPFILGERFTLTPNEDQLVARSGGKPVSGWRYWYNRWAPALPIKLRVRVPTLVWAEGEALASIVEKQDVRFATNVVVRHGIRERSYEQMSVTDHQLWI